MKRHVTCCVEKQGFEPRTVDTKAERYDHCATRPVKRTNYFLLLLITADCRSLRLNSLKRNHYCLLVYIITDYCQILLLLSIQVTACYFLELIHYYPLLPHLAVVLVPLLHHCYLITPELCFRCP